MSGGSVNLGPPLSGRSASTRPLPAARSENPITAYSCTHNPTTAPTACLPHTGFVGSRLNLHGAAALLSAKACPASNCKPRSSQFRRRCCYNHRRHRHALLTSTARWRPSPVFSCLSLWVPLPCQCFLNYAAPFSTSEPCSAAVAASRSALKR